MYYVLIIIRIWMYKLIRSRYWKIAIRSQSLDWVSIWVYIGMGIGIGIIHWQLTRLSLSHLSHSRLSLKPSKNFVPISNKVLRRTWGLVWHASSDMPGEHGIQIQTRNSSTCKASSNNTQSALWWSSLCNSCFDSTSEWTKVNWRPHCPQLPTCGGVSCEVCCKNQPPTTQKVVAFPISIPQPEMEQTAHIWTGNSPPKHWRGQIETELGNCGTHTSALTWQCSTKRCCSGTANFSDTALVGALSRVCPAAPPLSGSSHDL